MKKIIPLLVCTLLLTFCSQEKKMLRQASNAVDRSDFEKAIGYYDQIIHKNENSFFGNAGKGIVLSEFMNRHEQAIPYLEKALKNSPPEKSKPVVNGNLARSYHFIGNYKRALEYYGKLDNNPDYSDYDEFLSKRIADCKYAIEHPEVALPENQSLTNVGNTINTDKPEYTPVFTQGKMFFTSKRQDTDKEKKNGIDGKYFESVYVSEATGGGWSTPKRVELGETPGMNNKKYGTAVASVSDDGKTLFIYKGGKIFSTQIDDASHKMTELDKSINFSKLQNHVSVSPDGKTMFLTSESEQGRGGSDIYYCEKQNDGTWGQPKALDNTINTPYDEEAPYMNESGILFFSSNGHPGYGGFDVYRTKKVNGAWTKPENIGQPVNSPGDDIFFTLMPNSSKGYFASARTGGYGDLDIYKVHYMITDAPECKPAGEILAINATPDQANPLAYNIALNVPDAQKNNIRSYTWMINGKALAETKDNFNHVFEKPDTYVVTAKVVAACDTCPALMAMCSEKTVEVKNALLTTTDEDLNKNSGLAKHETSKGKKAGKNQKKVTGIAAENEQFSDNEDVAANNASEKNNSGKNNKNSGKNNKGQSDTDNDVARAEARVLSDDELKAMNWNTSPQLFELNTSTVNEDTKASLDQNATILKENKDLKVTITGHADSRGSNAYNKNLSLKRAQAVKQYFVERGVKTSQIKAVKGKGEEELVNNCSDGVDCDESQHAQNRRVVLEVTGKPVKGASHITQK